MNWPTFRIDEVADVYGGGTPSRIDAAFWGGDIPWITPTDLPRPGAQIAKITGSSERITKAGLDNSAATIMPPGSVLFSSRATIGKIGIAKIPVTTNQGFVNLIPRKVIESKFLAYCLQFFCADISRLAGSTTFKEVSRGNFRAFKIPLPAPKEQLRIVEILDQSDALRQKRIEADALADGILPALFNHCFGEPTKNPYHWPVCPLRELADFVSGATPSKENEAFWIGKIPWVSPKDMKQEELYDAIDHVSESAVIETNLKLLPEDTTLIVVRGMILAHTIPVCLARVPVTINQDMKGLRPKGGATSEFLQWALLAQHSGLLRLVSTAAHGTRKLDIDALGGLLIPVPPAPQRHLMKKWTGIVREQQSSARKRSKCRDSIEQIWQTVLYRAFTGELTAQWREAHLKELLAEMEQQARSIRSTSNGKN